MRDAAYAVTTLGMAAAGAPAWSALAGSANPSAMRGGACGGFDGINLTHKAIVRPLGLPGGDAG